MKKHIMDSIICSAIGMIILLSGKASAQSSSDSRSHSRFRFAQTYIGAELFYVPALSHAYYLDQNTHKKVRFSPGYRLRPRLIIGGPHFWGHAGFFIKFPVIGSWPNGSSRNNAIFNPGIETGFRLYPWSIYRQPVTPFAGFSWSSSSYKQSTPGGTAISLNHSTTYLQTGLNWHTHKSLIQIGIQYQPDHSFSYPLSRTRFGDVELSPWQTWVSYKYLFDATERSHHKNRAPDAEPRPKNAFSLAGGLSSAFGLTPTGYNDDTRPFLNNPVPAKLSPDLSVGYHFFDLDATLRVSYRKIIQRQQAFDVHQRFSREALSLELLKFWGDYYGFVPFTGLFAGHEILTAYESDYNDQTLDLHDRTWSWGFSFGWDIRPVPSPAVLLRTNIRYTPFLSLKAPNGDQISYNHLEVDFIQLVFYPRRILP